ncbi:MAG TPA: tripartite tricarboxylate transporter TctB family protein [Methylomirabilota bacterium]|jgi:hypothetical protein|nr:tripartite tricarboxylate transporter TctB family protein [Methylomirabilota bacterium]
MLERVVALVTVVGGGVYLSQALALPFGSLARPGAGFFPVAVAVFTCIVGAIMTVQAFVAGGIGGGTTTQSDIAKQVRGSGGSGTGPPVIEVEEEADPERRSRVLAGVVLLVAFCFLLPWVGYPLLAFAFVAILLRRLGSSWRGAAALAALSAGVSYYLFAVLLDVALPRGPW